MNEKEKKDRIPEKKPDFYIEMPQAVKTVLSRLEKAGYQAVLAGGCVRDALLGKTPHDFDVATSASPKQVEKLFEKTVPTGIAHGTVTVIEQGMPVEVTTFRKETGWSDHRHPDSVVFVEDLSQDLARRDFTINAMAWSPSLGLVDPFGGRKDLEQGIIRAVGDPDLRFEEDALRMLRAFRFAGRYGFEIEENTRKAIEKKTPLARNLAAERVVGEIEEIMEVSPQSLDEMTGLLSPWLPELEVMKNTPQNSIYHYTDVLHHTLDALSFLKPFDKACAWALLLHDSGKPEARVFYGGHDHFPKHADFSARIAKKSVKRLKLPKKLAAQIVDLVRMHDTYYGPKLINLYKLRVANHFDDEMVRRLFKVQEADIQAHTTQDRQKSVDEFRAFYEREKDRHPLSLKELQIDGHDAAAAGLEGAAISKALEGVLKEVILHPEKNTRSLQLELLEKEAAGSTRSSRK